jgi:hypothetical protein
MGALKIETTTGKVADLVVTDEVTEATIAGVIGISFGIGKNTATPPEDIVIATITIVPASVSFSSVEGAVKVVEYSSQ